MERSKVEEGEVVPELSLLNRVFIDYVTSSFIRTTEKILLIGF